MARLESEHRRRLLCGVAAPIPVQTVTYRFHLRQIALDKLVRRRVHDRCRRADIQGFMAPEVRFDSKTACTRRVTHVDVAPERARAADGRILLPLLEQRAMRFG